MACARGFAMGWVLLLAGVGAAAGQGRRATAPSAGGPQVIAPEGPTVVFDTSAGRLTCRLYAKQAPVTVANFVALVRGTKAWTDGAGAAQQGKAFYDGTQVIGITDGIDLGDRESTGQGSAGAAVTPEKTALGLDAPGRLVALLKDGKQSAGAVAVLDHADEEYAKRAVVFGQCDEASAKVAGGIAHTLLSADNRPAHPVVLRRAVIVEEGQAMPEAAPAMAGEAELSIPPYPAAAVPAPEPAGPTATIETSMGTISCRLFSKEAPVGVANFIGLVNGTKAFKNPRTGAMVRGKRFYDGLHFGRVIPDFMIQNNDQAFDPGGDLDIGIKFANEVVPGLSFDRAGRLAYANAGPGTNASEFFITEGPVRRLDGHYTIFGQCDDAGVAVVHAIAAVPRDAKNKPLTAVVIRKISVEAK